MEKEVFIVNEDDYMKNIQEPIKAYVPKNLEKNIQLTEKALASYVPDLEEIKTEIQKHKIELCKFKLEHDMRNLSELEKYEFDKIELALFRNEKVRKGIQYRINLLNGSLKYYRQFK